MAKLSEESKEHLEAALEEEHPSEKDFHIRQVLQACSIDDLLEESKAK
ncbi:hypothetical protein OB955_19790 [Halobacteria archaeon AArc-m2/3/4]|uniref:Uncharacterized protein n=1 Tax=Natronoglomus mannanivorans TaxID=2979990 RepID=A0ABT2QJ76_9EURY|nr:hypothetical protein [Halobacteria archaeon AArc-m2/3/4]